MTALHRPVHSPTDSHAKYTQTNFVTRQLLDGFFGAVECMIAGLNVTTVIEIGCGAGFSTERLRDMFPRSASFRASDIDPNRIELARSKVPTVPVEQESVYALPHPDKSFDLVFILEVLEHLTEPEKALAEVCRISRRWVVASVPREPLWRLMNLARFKYVNFLGNTPGHLNHWSAASFNAFVDRRVRVVECRRPLPWTIVLADLQAANEAQIR